MDIIHDVGPLLVTKASKTVKRSGFGLMYASERLQLDKDVVLESVKKDRLALGMCFFSD